MNIREIVGLAPVIPVLTITELEHAVPLALALLAGGLRVLEITLRTPVALAAIEAMRKAVPDAIIGVGTLTRAVDFAAADRVGARFGVTPGLTPELAAASRGARFPLLPGVMTPTELIAARNAGFNVLEALSSTAAGRYRHGASTERDVSGCGVLSDGRNYARHGARLFGIIQRCLRWRFLGRAARHASSGRLGGHRGAGAGRCCAQENSIHIRCRCFHENPLAFERTGLLISGPDTEIICVNALDSEGRICS